MGICATHTVPAPREDVWAWHSRPGAVVRLTPPFVPMRPVRQAGSLADGTTEFRLPGGLTWRARHDPAAHREGECFRDVAANQPVRFATRWSHTHSFDDAPGGETRITDEVDTTVPARLIAPAFAYRQRQLAADFDFLATLPPTRPLTVAVTGSSGLVGTALCAQLTTAGHSVIRLVRDRAAARAADARYWDVADPAPDLLDGVDAVAHLAGESIMGRFTDSKKRRIESSRVAPTRALAQRAADAGVAAFVSASAVGFYGTDAGEHDHGEDAPEGAGFLAQVCRKWEEAARVEGPRCVSIRTGLVLSGAGGILPLFRLQASTGLGARIGRGNFWMSWVALDDLTDLYVRALVDPDLEGPVNATAPEPVTNAVFSAELTRLTHRPDLVSVPRLAPAVVLGGEGARELALANQRVVPTAALHHGARFRYPGLGAALAHELGRETLVEDRPART